MTPRKAEGFLRWVCAAGIAVFFLYCSLVIAYLPGFRLPGQTAWKLLDDWPVVVVSVLSALVGIASARWIVRKRVLSWWLLLAIPIPALVTADVLRQLSS